MAENRFARLFSGLDRPRPLPPELRSRLEEQLLSQAAVAHEPRPLPDDLSTRLAERLEEEAAPLRPRRATLGRPRWAGLAAALLIAAGVAAALTVPSAGTHHANNTALRPSAPPFKAAGNAPSSAGSSSGAGGSGSGGASASSAGGPAVQGPSTGGASGSALSGSASAASGSASAAPTGATPGAAAGASGLAQPAPAPPPTVQSLSPASGPVTGGTWVTIVGEHFSGTTAVRFGSSAARQFSVVSAGEIKALSPAHLPGSVTVVVVTPTGTSSASRAATFDYTA